MKKIITALVLFLVCIELNAVPHYKVKVVKEYPHSTSSYTQGLFFYDGVLFESTGQYGKSVLHKLDLATGKTLKETRFSKKYFGEGSVVLDGKLYMLTWTNKVAFVYDPSTLKYELAYSYPREGWGITTDGKSLIASDGSSWLYFMDRNFKLKKKIQVTTSSGKALRLLNELEWIDGKIWANVYTTDMIVIIDPETGRVEGVVDCTGLLPDKLKATDTDVLNGIAVDSNGRIFLTGKNWPRLYEVRLVEN